MGPGRTGEEAERIEIRQDGRVEKETFLEEEGMRRRKEVHQGTCRSKVAMAHQDQVEGIVDLHFCMMAVRGIGASEIGTCQIAWANEISVYCRMVGESGRDRRQEEGMDVDQSAVHLQQDSHRTLESADGLCALKWFVFLSVSTTNKGSC